MSRVFGFLASVLFVLASSGVLPAAAQSSAELARTVPIADMHMHLGKGYGPEHYRAQMERNNVRWGGGVGGGPKDDPVAMRAALGPRYLPAIGQTEFFAVFFMGGAAALSDPDRPQFKALFERAEREFRAGTVRGFGEIHINNVSRFSPAGIQRKIPLESPVVMEMFRIADKHGGFVQIHTSRNSGLEEVLRVAERFRRTRLILSHCLPGAGPAELAELFSRTKNIFCELSAQGPAHGVERVYDRNGIKPGWREVIVAHADRFMLGTDPCCGLEERYDALVSEIREHLLPALPPAVIRKVAYENALREFGLPR
jgi:predicted TIM-barrel fold metal-dependent hydrolase